MKKKEISLDDMTTAVDSNLLPSGSRIYDTSRSEKGRQIYPRQRTSKIIKDIKEELGYEDDGFDDDGHKEE